MRLLARAQACGQSCMAVCAIALLVAGCAGSPPELARNSMLKPAGVVPAAPPEPPARRIGSPYAYEWFMRAELYRAESKLAPALDAYRQALSSSEEDPHVLARYATALDE